LESLYWVPLQTVKVAWSLAKALPVQDILAGAPGSIAFAASAASTAMVQSCCLTSDAWKEGGHAVALELAPYCRKLLRYLLSAVQALQEPYTGGKLSDAIAARSAAMVAAAEAAEAAAWAKFTASAIAPTAPAVAKAGAEAAAGSSAGAGKDEGRGKSQSTARSEGTEKSDSTEKSEGEGTGKSESAEKSDALRSMRDASTQTAGPLVTSVHLTTFEPTKEELQINLLLILAALHLSKGLSDKLVQNDPSLKVEEWVMQLVTLAADTLSLLCNLLEDGRWRAAAVKHQPLLLLHATCTGLQVGCRCAAVSFSHAHRSSLLSLAACQLSVHCHLMLQLTQPIHACFCAQQFYSIRLSLACYVTPLSPAAGAGCPGLGRQL
jgi:hypothetical protein